MASVNRRAFLQASAGAAALPFAACIARPMPVGSPYASLVPARDESPIVNDVHSQLNRTRVSTIVKPRSVDQLQEAVHAAAAAGRPVSIAGGRHAMGGQQFGEDTVLIDTRALSGILDFDADK